MKVVVAQKVDPSIWGAGGEAGPQTTNNRQTPNNNTTFNANENQQRNTHTIDGSFSFSIAHVVLWVVYGGVDRTNICARGRSWKSRNLQHMIAATTSNLRTRARVMVRELRK